MASPVDNSRESRSFLSQEPLRESWQDFWSSIVRIAFVEIACLALLAFALVCYLDWSSEVSVAEFMAASQSPPAASAPFSAVKDRKACDYGA